MPDVNPAGWRKTLSISMGHLTGATLLAAETWPDALASRESDLCPDPRPPVPMFGRHPFGFYCATITAMQAAPGGDWPNAPADLRDALIWANEQGAEYVTFDADGDTHDGLPDHEATHGGASPCPVDQPPPGCVVMTGEDGCHAIECRCPLAAISAAMIAATETT